MLRNISLYALVDKRRELTERQESKVHELIALDYSALLKIRDLANRLENVIKVLDIKQKMNTIRVKFKNLPVENERKR